MPQIDSPQRLAILGNPDAQDCTLYRPDEEDPDAEELDLGDAKVLFTGAFQAPADWDELERAEFFGDAEPDTFVSAYIECAAKPGSAGFFVADIGDYVASMPGQGAVVMFYVHDYVEDRQGRHYTLIRDDEPLD